MAKLYLYAGHATSPGMQMFTLRRLRPAIAWLGSFQRLQRKFMRHSLAIFSTSRTALRVQALLFIRQMATMIPGSCHGPGLEGRDHRRCETLHCMLNQQPNICKPWYCIPGAHSLLLLI